MEMEKKHEEMDEPLYAPIRRTGKNFYLAFGALGLVVLWAVVAIFINIGPDSG